MLNDFLSHMTRCIDGHGGTVDKFIGDAVMAVFPLDDEGSGALAAAIAMHDELERFNRYLTPSLPKLAMGVGIHGGQVVSGLIGSAQKREQTVIGDVVNTASRLESLTKKLGAPIVISADALGATDQRRYLLRPLGRVAPRGRKMGVNLFDAMGPRDLGATSRAADAEIQRVEAALATFTDRQFDESARLFDQLATDAKEAARVRGYEILAAKARELAGEAPPSSWRGEIALSD
jgi:class 3 adenylate cyclase